MFLHLGENVVVPLKDVIGIYDIETSMYSSDTSQFLRMAEEVPINKKSKIYMSPISSSTLIKRSEIVYYEP